MVYISRVTAENGTCANVTRSIYTAIKDTPLKPKLKIIGCDSTAVMISKNNSCIASLEALIGRPLQ